MCVNSMFMTSAALALFVETRGFAEYSTPVDLEAIVHPQPRRNGGCQKMSPIRGPVTGHSIISPVWQIHSMSCMPTFVNSMPYMLRCHLERYAVHQS